MDNVESLSLSDLFTTCSSIYRKNSFKPNNTYRHLLFQIDDITRLKDKNGNNILHLIACSDERYYGMINTISTEIVKKMLQSINFHDKSPLDYALEYNNDRVLDLYCKYNGNIHFPYFFTLFNHGQIDTIVAFGCNELVKYVYVFFCDYSKKKLNFYFFLQMFF